MELGEANDSLEIPGLTPNPGRVVVEIHPEPRRVKDRGERADEAVDDAKSKQITPVLDEPVVIDSEDVRALARWGSASERKKESTEQTAKGI